MLCLVVLNHILPTDTSNRVPLGAEFTKKAAALFWALSKDKPGTPLWKGTNKGFKNTLSLPYLPYGEGCTYPWALLGCSGLVGSWLPVFGLRELDSPFGGSWCHPGLCQPLWPLPFNNLMNVHGHTAQFIPVCCKILAVICFGPCSFS